MRLCSLNWIVGTISISCSRVYFALGFIVEVKVADSSDVLLKSVGEVS